MDSDRSGLLPVSWSASSESSHKELLFSRVLQIDLPRPPGRHPDRLRTCTLQPAHRQLTDELRAVVAVRPGDRRRSRRSATRPNCCSSMRWTGSRCRAWSSSRHLRCRRDGPGADRDPGLERRLARYAQLFSRIGFVHEFRPLGAAKARALLASWWPAGVRLPEDLLADAGGSRRSSGSPAGIPLAGPPADTRRPDPRAQRAGGRDPRGRRGGAGGPGHRRGVAAVGRQSVGTVAGGMESPPCPGRSL